MAVTWGGRNGHGSGRAEFHNAPSKYAREKQAIKDMTEAGIKFDRPAK